jgi:hypothetical protein
MDAETLGPPTTKALFYADVGTLHGSDASHLQCGLDLLTDLFSRLGLQMNVSKTKSLVVSGGAPFFQISPNAYKRRLTGDGLSYRETKRIRVECPMCYASFQAGHLASHNLLVHGISPPHPYSSQPPAPALPSPTTYIVSMPLRNFPTDCPVPHCVGRVSLRSNLRRHFAHRHPEDVIIIAEEGRLPRCSRCGLFTNITARHHSTKFCIAGHRRQTLRAEALALRSSPPASFTVNGSPLEAVPSFLYLGRWLSHDDSDWFVVIRNIQKAHTRWGMISRLLSRQGASPRIMSVFYKTIVQSVLLYGSETWVLTSRLRNLLSSFHHHCARFIARRWIYQIFRWYLGVPSIL